MKRILGLAALLMMLAGACATTPPALPASGQPAIEAAVLHPIFDTWFLTSEHYDGQSAELGDALGSDCIVGALVEEEGRTWLRFHRGDGARNEDWYGWGRKVLAPLSGEVLHVHVNPTVNEPGTMIPGIASLVLLRGDDGTHVMVAHLDSISVKAGDRVQAGQPIGLVGNNGHSRHPHIHLGAWRGETPLQIRFDLRAMAKLRTAADRQ